MEGRDETLDSEAKNLGGKAGMKPGIRKVEIAPGCHLGAKEGSTVSLKPNRVYRRSDVTNCKFEKRQSSAMSTQGDTLGSQTIIHFITDPLQVESNLSFRSFSLLPTLPEWFVTVRLSLVK